jgi:hypothetical protein
MSNKNRYLEEQAAVLESPITFTPGVGDSDVSNNVQAVIDLISYEGTDPNVKRLFLDEMSPAARASLYRILTDLQASITEESA